MNIARYVLLSREAATLAFSFVPAAIAQQFELPAITTEGPTASSLPDLIPRGTAQVETGAGLSLRRAHPIADLPGLLLRPDALSSCSV